MCDAIMEIGDGDSRFAREIGVLMRVQINSFTQYSLKKIYIRYSHNQLLGLLFWIIKLNNTHNDNLITKLQVANVFLIYTCFYYNRCKF